MCSETQWEGQKPIEATFERDEILDIREKLFKTAIINTSEEQNEMMHKEIQGYIDDSPPNEIYGHRN